MPPTSNNDGSRVPLQWRTIKRMVDSGCVLLTASCVNASRGKYAYFWVGFDVIWNELCMNVVPCSSGGVEGLAVVLLDTVWIVSVTVVVVGWVWIKCRLLSVMRNNDNDGAQLDWLRLRQVRLITRENLITGNWKQTLGNVVVMIIAVAFVSALFYGLVLESFG